MTADEKLEELPATEESSATEDSSLTEDSSVTDESSVTEQSAPTEESRATEGTDDDRSHLSDLADGSGCTEIWEHLSEQRERETDEE